jgi:N-acylneuraminate cytidylyltransferase/CMP-N,N'-diacetyllegionaminic acid synthase
MTTFAALIPARGGSRRIPRKNLRPIAGKPMIAWTIEAAQRSKAIHTVIVTTDDEGIATVSRNLGAEVPFIRPAALASDEADSVSVVVHALDFMRERGDSPAALALLQPTSPLRTAEDIDRAATIYREKGASAVVSVKCVERPVHWLRRIGASGELFPYTENGAPITRSAEPIYELNGAIYLLDAEMFARERTFFPDRCFAYVMPPERSIDIDTPWDLRLAELLMRDIHAA